MHLISPAEPGNMAGPFTFRSIAASAFLAITATLPLQAQDGDQHLVYRFSVQGIATPEAAKPVQVALLDEPFARECHFIDACDCFKLAVNDAIGYAALRGALLAAGYSLGSVVHASDGTTLQPPPEGVMHDQ